MISSFLLFVYISSFMITTALISRMVKKEGRKFGPVKFAAHIIFMPFILVYNTYSLYKEHDKE